MTEIFMIFALIVGSFFILTAGIGIVRLPDTLCQAHPLSKAVTLGLSLILIATVCSLSEIHAWVKVLLVIAFHFVTVPLAGHIFALYAVQYEHSPTTNDH